MDHVVTPLLYITNLLKFVIYSKNWYAPLQSNLTRLFEQHHSNTYNF